MTTAHETAMELRKLADALDQDPAIQIAVPSVYFSYRYGGNDAKDNFLNLVHCLPRPLKKDYGDGDLNVGYHSPALRIHTSIERSKVCRLVTPAQEAVFECEPLLSSGEEDLISA